MHMPVPQYGYRAEHLARTRGDAFPTCGAERGIDLYERGPVVPWKCRCNPRVATGSCGIALMLSSFLPKALDKGPQNSQDLHSHFHFIVGDGRGHGLFELEGLSMSLCEGPDALGRKPYIAAASVFVIRAT